MNLINKLKLHEDEVISKHFTALPGNRFLGDVMLIYNGIPITCYDAMTANMLIGRIDDLNPKYKRGRFYNLGYQYLSFIHNKLFYWRDSSVNSRILNLCDKFGWYKN